MIKDIIQAAFIITPRKLAAFVGQIISTGSIIGNVSRIMNRHCNMSVAISEET